MFQLSNTASFALEYALAEMPVAKKQSEFGSRFQLLVAEVLRNVPGLDDLYDNKGAGQPDCYSNRGGFGFEIKTRSDVPIELDDNSWTALSRYSRPRLVVALTEMAPFPMWVVDLTGVPRGPINLRHGLTTDHALERHLHEHLSTLIEALGASRMAVPLRSHFEALVTDVARGTQFSSGHVRDAG